MTREKNNNSKIMNMIVVFFLIIALVTSGFAIFEISLLSSIENLLRYIVMGLLVLLDIFFILKTRKYIKGRFNKRSKRPKKKLFIFVLFIYSLICGAVGGAIFFVYDQISGINKQYVTYTSDLLVMSKNEATDIKDIKNMTIGILNDKKSPEGYIIPQEIIKEHNLEDENEIKKYDDYTSMLVDMYGEELDGMFVSDHYVSMFSGITGYENISTDTKVIISKDKKMKKAATSIFETSSAGKNITEPFTILLMGIDSTDEVLTKNAIANGDTLILITFNPKTLNATMLSIPRDSYVPISCWSGHPENKITHAAAYGNDCMINTIQDYLDVNIDYYAKINFKGLVNLVNAVGGVEVDVPKELCTDDSSRGKQVCIKPGRQVLMGEEALVFARNRKQLADGDFGRAAHQQEIVMALINKMKTIKDVSTFMDILNTISNSLDTNLTTKQILSFYNVGKDIVKKGLSSEDANLVNIQQLFLAGNGQMIYDERAKMVLWDYVPNKDSRKDIIHAMKENLELEEHETIKEFHFSINKPYEKPIIGEGPYRTGYTYNLLPSFIGLSESQARALASKYGISVSFTGGNGFVISQSQPANRRLDLMGRSVTLTLGGNKKDDDEDKEKEKETDKDKKTDDEEDDDSGNTSGGSSGGNTSGGSEGGNTSGGSEGGNTSGNDDQGSSETSQQNP